jgi:oxalate decarboxylase/phosphoglucose isomerase-like protein (cupin superfamily)
VDTYPSIAQDKRPLECVQNPGEFMFFPEGWHHATVNFGDTIGVTFESQWEAPTMADFEVLHHEL